MKSMRQVKQRQWCFRLLSVTTVVEHVFCPKFTYYGIVMGLGQYEQKRGTVSAGKKHHEKSEKTNKSYIPQNIKGTKINSQKFYSKKYGFVGIVDHAILTPNSIVLVERKHSKQAKIYDTLRVQIGLLSILLEENFQKPVTSALVLFSYNQTPHTL